MLPSRKVTQRKSHKVLIAFTALMFIFSSIAVTAYAYQEELAQFLAQIAIKLSPEMQKEIGQHTASLVGSSAKDVRDKKDKAVSDLTLYSNQLIQTAVGELNAHYAAELAKVQSAIDQNVNQQETGLDKVKTDSVTAGKALITIAIGSAVSGK